MLQLCVFGEAQKSAAEGKNEYIEQERIHIIT